VIWAPTEWPRVERVERVLEDHLQTGDGAVVAPLHRQVGEIDVAELDLAAGRVLEPHPHLREGRLAAAGFADDGDRLASWARKVIFSRSP